VKREQRMSPFPFPPIMGCNVMGCNGKGCNVMGCNG
jgi:hypothetical protein